MTSPKKPLKIPGATLLEGIVPFDKAQLPLDALAGITLAALAIPEVMGYAQIAGMPVVTGLYTLLIPLALFAFLGSSRHLVVSADSATAAVLAATLVSMLPRLPGMSPWPRVALLAGVFLFAPGLFRSGFISIFVPDSPHRVSPWNQVALGHRRGLRGLAEGTNIVTKVANIASRPGR
jgi:hypothetical protein